jgi:predicted GNAT family N-acyltransferase
VAELIESYRLRYEVYGALGYLRRTNPSKLEIDEYDASAVAFGAFDLTTGALVGTVRLITTQPHPEYAPLVRRVVADLEDPELALQALGRRPQVLPSILSQDIARQIEAFNAERHLVHELSRAIVRPGQRGAGMSRGLMEFGIAHAAQFGPAILIGGCLPEHLPMYGKYGFQPLPEIGLARFESVGQIANAIICRSDALPEPTRSHVEDLLDAMASGATECTLEIGRDSRALYRFATPRRARRRTQEW